MIKSLRHIVALLILAIVPYLAFAQEGASSAHENAPGHSEAHEAAPTAQGAAHDPAAAHASGSEAHGAGHDAHGGGGIPMDVIYQAINFLLFAGLLVYFLRKPTIDYFRNRETSYKQALVRAEAARREAEEKRQQMQERLSQLEKTSAQTVNQARAEAEELKAKIIAEAKDLSRNLQDEARRTATAEIERATQQLREELLSQSLAVSRKLLADKMAEPDQKRLQTEFVDKIQVVR